MLEAEGFDHIAYINTVEGKGSPSILVLDAKHVKLANREVVAEAGGEKTAAYKAGLLSSGGMMLNIDEAEAAPSERKLKERRVNRVSTLLKGKGFTDNAIAGIMGNIDIETAGSFDPKQKQIGGGNGYGLFQFDFQRSYYNSYLKQEGRPDSIAAQLDFMYDVIYSATPPMGMNTSEKRALRQTLETGTAEEVALDFMRYYEKPGKPHEARRIKAASKYKTN